MHCCVHLSFVANPQEDLATIRNSKASCSDDYELIPLCQALRIFTGQSDKNSGNSRYLLVQFFKSCYFIGWKLSPGWRAQLLFPFLSDFSYLLWRKNEQLKLRSRCPQKSKTVQFRPNLCFCNGYLVNKSREAVPLNCEERKDKDKLKKSTLGSRINWQ
jgi:hypothetical protein